MSNADTGALLRQMREQRMVWIELVPAAGSAPAKRVRIIRPNDVEISRHLLRADTRLAVDYEAVVRFTVDWAGFSAADLLGPSIGASDPLDYEASLWTELIATRSDWLGLVSKALLDATVAYIQKQEVDRKN